MKKLVATLVVLVAILGCKKPEVVPITNYNNITFNLDINRENVPNLTGKTIGHPVLDSLVPITFDNGSEIVEQLINYSNIEGFTYDLADGDYTVNSTTDFDLGITPYLPFNIEDTISIDGDGEYEIEAVSNYAAIVVNDTQNISNGLTINSNSYTQQKLYVLSGERYVIRIPYSVTLNNNTFNGAVDIVIQSANANTNYVYSLDYIVHTAIDSSITLSLVLTDTFNDVTQDILVEHFEDECNFADGVTAETSIEPILLQVFDTNGGNGVALFSNGLNDDAVWYRSVAGYPDPSWDGAYQNYTPGGSVAFDPLYTHSQAPEPDYEFIDDAGAWSDDVELSFSWDNDEYIGCIGGVDNFTVEWIIGDTRYNDYRAVQSPNLELGVHFIYAIITHQGETLVLSHFIEKTDGTTGKTGIRTGKVKRPARQ